VVGRRGSADAAGITCHDLGAARPTASYLAMPTSAGSAAADWIGAIGHLLGGGAAVVALLFGVRQFRRGGFTYRLYTSIDEEGRVIRITVSNTGRLAGYITEVNVVNRRSIVGRIRLVVSRRAGQYASISSEICPVTLRSQGTTVTLTAPQVIRGGAVSTALFPTGAVSVEVPPGAAFEAYIVRTAKRSPIREDHPPYVSTAVRRRWLLVRIGFGDGRVAREVPQRVPGVYRL
jgi:hypothetical protein